ncbi:hypothetical protein LZ575_03965 [Antarcticibacterium sp. 1MA-6-2]|uniref:hypothetical protein n=1 Tax=Antarcticibacterium sp. 1MA-6-2 TaxID=2908210 RepID=UPI001F22B65E|nr:hypothetical protein [Antarcticibacterium sp. 1MA-6-2]UJH91826.1 hypothetical protein LZ575_03965 [Antarcticibacterium sp. 1MA-6-2]
MSSLKKHIILFFALALLFPSAVSLTHIYAHEIQVECNHESQVHLHKKNIDCELCHLQHSSFFTFAPFNFELFQPEIFNKKFFLHYQFLSEYQRLSFGLRAPPVV